MSCEYNWGVLRVNGEDNINRVFFDKDFCVWVIGRENFVFDMCS